jgi:hypothetical protein
LLICLLVIVYSLFILKQYDISELIKLNMRHSQHTSDHDHHNIEQSLCDMKTTNNMHHFTKRGGCGP